MLSIGIKTVVIDRIVLIDKIVLIVLIKMIIASLLMNDSHEARTKKALTAVIKPLISGQNNSQSWTGYYFT